MNVDKFTRVLMTGIQQNPALLEADRRTLFAAIMRAAQDGLLPDGREGAIVTFKSQGKPEPQAQWMPMVAGIMKKVRNSGEIMSWSVQVVKENDDFNYELGDEERITHKPALNARGKTIGAYSIVKLKSGETVREYMGMEEVEAIRKRSRSATSGPWVTDFDEMAKKTVIRRHSKRLPQSTDLDQVLNADDTLFMPEQNQPEAAPAEQQQRPAALQRVLDAAGAPTGSPATTAIAGQAPPDQTPHSDDTLPI